MFGIDTPLRTHALNPGVRQTGATTSIWQDVSRLSDSRPSELSLISFRLFRGKIFPRVVCVFEKIGEAQKKVSLRYCQLDCWGEILLPC